MQETPKREPMKPIGPEVVLTGSKDLTNGMVLRIETKVRDKRVEITGLSRIGESYTGNKKATEDGCVVVKNEDAIIAIVVDGGTQVDRLASFNDREISGGFYIRSKVEEHGQKINPQVSIAQNLHTVNGQIGENTKIEHPDVDYEERYTSVPYGSICGIKIDMRDKIIEAANAGDAFVIVIQNGAPVLLSVDDVYEKDQQTFRTARRLADTYGFTFRHAMQNRTYDERLKPIVDETFETMRMGKIGKIKRITGGDNFGLSSWSIISLEGVESVFLFTDGAIPGGINIHKQEGLEEWYGIVRERGIEGLEEEIRQRAESDPDFERYPRFGNIDDLMLLAINF